MELEKKLVCFDLDGTLTFRSTWEAFNARLGITPEDDKRLFEKYLAGEQPYESWIAALLQLYRQNDAVTKEEIENVAQDIELRPGAIALAAAAKEKGYEVILVSGSVDTIVRVCAARLHIGEWFSTNKAVYDGDDRELVDIETMGDERDAKLLLLKEYCLKNGYDIEGSIAVGNGGNEKEIFIQAKGILLGDNKELLPLAWKQVNSLSEVAQYL
jgi:HAD superfamily phosphoserine phosphatase-like hydrolase